MLIFLHIPKTAGTTFRFILENHFGVHCCHTNHIRGNHFDQKQFELAKKVFPGLQCLTGHSLIAPYELKVSNPFFATILRDPVDRVISHYQANFLRGKATGNFEEDFRNNPYLQDFQVRKITGGDDLPRAKQFLDVDCEFVGLTENFDLSLAIFQRLYPEMIDVNYYRKNVAKTNDLKEELKSDRRIIKLIERHNQLDIQLYDYARNEIFPRMCEKAEIDMKDSFSFDKRSKPFTRKRQIGRIFNKYIYRTVCKIAG